MIRHLQIIISGKLENTGFRLYALWGASQMEIKGSVEQQPDQIIIEAEGEESDVEQFVQWCKKGPESSKIDSFETIEKNIKSYQDFKIL
jgi:acylphosphatase